MWLAKLQEVRAARRTDAGFMLPMALFITMIAVAASTLVVGMVLFSIGQTQIGASRVQDNSTAEAGLDAAIAALEQSSGTTTPCGFSGTPGPNNGATFDVTIEYFSQTPSLDGSGNPIPLTCTPGTGVSGTPYNAMITSTGQTTGSGPAGSTATQRMEAMVRLRVGSGGDPWTNGFSAAVSAGQALALSTNWNVTGAGGNVYVTNNPTSPFTAGTFSCSSNMSISGNLYAQSSISLGGGGSPLCQVVGDMWSGAGTTVTDPSTVTGNVKVNGTLSIPAPGTLTVSGDASYLAPLTPIARLTAGTTHAGVVVGSPPLPAQPKVVYNAADWAGWSIITPAAGVFPCETAGAWVSNPWSSPAGPTVYRALCNPVWDPSGPTATLILNGDVTIILGSGNNIDVVDNLVVNSGDGQPHKLRIIVPFATLTTPCAGAPTRTMRLRSQVTMNTLISGLFYTSGRFDHGGTAVMNGQIFACRVTSTGAMTLDYRTVGAPSSATSGGSGTGNYEVDVLYRRDGVG